MTILKMSSTYAPTLKEDPAGADIASHRLLLRSGMIRQNGSGTYTFLPLGMRVLNKIQQIIREEMNAKGAQEILMPILQPAELWHESGRWDDYGPEMMRLTDRHDREICLGPTHEELITDLVRNELRSYKQLPCTLWQMQVKFRDEMRPRFGLFRTREFIMKDAYSFNATRESLDESYRDMEVAYARVNERLGIDYRMVTADSGEIGGNESIEFMALADAGESDLVYCDCGFAADTEAAECGVVMAPAQERALEKIATPGVHTIEELATFLDVPENATVKALSGKGADGRVYVMFIPGDHELNDIKANKAVAGWQLLTDDEMVAAGLHKGSMGPVDLPEGVGCVCDSSLKDVHAWAVGANEDGFHFLGAEPGRDFEPTLWADLVMAKPDDLCPVCGKKLKGARGIEVSQVFKLGTKYSEAMGATFMDEDGKEKPFIMGCYGIGVTRSMAAVIEQRNDDDGMFWPVSIAPAEVIVVPLSVGDELVDPLARDIAAKLDEAGIEVMLDDRDERAGVKFADADLIGWPVQVVVGKRGVKEGVVEVKRRGESEKTKVPFATLAEALAFVKRAARNNKFSRTF